MKKKFGFGIVRAGVISEVHALAIGSIENATLIGVYSIHKDKSDVLADKFNCTAYDTLDEMLSHPQIDIVCVCTPSGIHFDPAIKGIETGKNCLIDKLLEVTLEKCDQIIEAAQNVGVKIGVIFPSCFYQAAKQLKHALNEKRFDDLVLGDAYIKWNRTPEDYQSEK